MHLIKPLVVLSSSRVALALIVGLRELRRLQCVGVPNLTDREVKAFVLQMFEEFNFDKKNIKAVESKITPVVGNTLSTLYYLSKALKDKSVSL